MTNIYVVERIPENAYNELKNGNIFYACNAERVEIEAETETEAFYKACKVGYVINKNYIKTKEEIEAIAEAERKAKEIQAQKEAERKEKRKNNEERKAKEMGMTVQQYRHEKRKQAQIRKIEKQIAELTAELERIKKEG